MASVHVKKAIFARENIEHAWVSNPGLSPIHGDDLTIDQDAPVLFGFPYFVEKETFLLGFSGLTGKLCGLSNKRLQCSWCGFRLETANCQFHFHKAFIKSEFTAQQNNTRITYSLHFVHSVCVRHCRRCMAELSKNLSLILKEFHQTLQELRMQCHS